MPVKNKNHIAPQTNIADHAEALAEILPINLHPHDVRIVAVVPCLASPGYGEEHPTGYGDCAVVTQDQDGYFWTTRHTPFGHFISETSRKSTTIRLAMRHAYTMCGW